MALNGFLLKATLACAASVCCAGFAASQETPLLFKKFGHGVYRLEASFTVPARSSVVWEVLTDYEGMPGFVSSLKKSRVLGRRGGKVLLEQEGTGGISIFTRDIRVLLDVKEWAPTMIEFEDIAGEDFEYYAGSWRIEPRPEGMKVSYRLDVKRRFSAPDFVATHVFKKNIEGLLAEVRREIIRRANLSRKSDASVNRWVPRTVVDALSPMGGRS